MTLSFWHWELNLGVLFKSLYEKVKSFASCLSPIRFKTKENSRPNACSSPVLGTPGVTAVTLSVGF